MSQPMQVRWSRPMEGEVTSLSISKDAANRYFVSILCQVEIVSKPITKQQLGIDMGLTSFVVTSEGVKYSPIKALKIYENKLSRLQRRLSKKQKGSNNRNKARIQVAKVHAKIADIRKDFLQKVTSKLINENQVICIEDLHVKGMMKNRKLAKSIGDASWGNFVAMLEYKADWYGRRISKVDRFYPSSQLCSTCGYRSEKKPLQIRQWQCSNCNREHDRDINAAKNIKTAGLAGLACGVSSVGHQLVVANVDMA